MASDAMPAPDPAPARAPARPMASPTKLHAAPPPTPPATMPFPRRLRTAAGLFLISGWLLAFAAGQIVIGGPMFYTILPDWSATQSLDNDGHPTPGSIIPREVVLTWAAIGVALSIASAFSFVAWKKARRGKATACLAWGLASTVFTPLNPLSILGSVLAARACRAPAEGPLRQAPASTDPSPSPSPSPSGMLRAGTWVLLAGAVSSAFVVVASVVEAVFMAAGILAEHPPPEAVAMMLSTDAFLAAMATAGTVVGVLAWHKARRGAVSAAAGWGLAAGLVAPFNPITLLGSLLCFAAPERQGILPPPSVAAPPVPPPDPSQAP